MLDPNDLSIQQFPNSQFCQNSNLKSPIDRKKPSRFLALTAAAESVSLEPSRWSMNPNTL